MNLKDTLQALCIPEAEEDLAADWDRIVAVMPHPVPFLQADYVAWACDLAHLTPEMTAAAQATAARVAADAAAASLAWYAHSKLFAAGIPRAQPRHWPMLTEALGVEHAGMFNVLVLLSGTPHMLEIHRRRCIPPDVTDATMLDLRLQLETQDYLHMYHRPGLTPWILGWLLLHWRGELVRLGRLQYATSVFRYDLHVYRRRSDGAVVALSTAGVHFRADGQVDGAGGIKDTTGAWTSVFEESAAGVKGNLVTPWGNGVAEPVYLPAEEWQQVLAPGDPVLDIHIPTGSPMDYDQCGESIRWALEFFPRHFADRPFVGFACGSWILDNQFEAMLPPSSNLVRFQQEVYLFPLDDEEGYSAIRTVFGYGSKLEELPGFPRRTGMQRAFAAHLEAGGRFHSGGCFLLKDDFAWSSNYYRRHWPY